MLLQVEDKKALPIAGCCLSLYQSSKVIRGINQEDFERNAYEYNITKALFSVVYGIYARLNVFHRLSVVNKVVRVNHAYLRGEVS